MREYFKDERKLTIAVALLALYWIWGSTFLAIRFAIDSFPPFLSVSLRFLVAGIILYVWLRMRGVPRPVFKEWLAASAIGFLLLVVGNGGVAYAEMTVSTSASALVIATMPLWVAIFSCFWKVWPTTREWLGITLGIIGVVVLNMGGEMRATPLGAMVLLLAAASWAFGSIWGKSLKLPSGAMSGATQMLVAGVMLALFSLAIGEPWPQHVSEKSFYAMLYLIIFGSLVAYSAYLFLLRTVRPALATSYAFVNPIVAMFLASVLSNEHLGHTEFLALAIIICAVLLVLPFKRPR